MRHVPVERTERRCGTRPFARRPGLGAFARARRNGAEGFSLLEILVSLAMAALFMAAVIRALGANWFQSSSTSEVIRATILARALLAEARLLPLESGTVRSGTTGGYRWRTTIRPIELQLPASVLGMPPLGASPGGASPHNASPASVSEPAGGNGARAILRLFQVAVDVAAPSGRRNSLEGLVMRPPAPPRGGPGGD